MHAPEPWRPPPVRCESCGHEGEGPLCSRCGWDTAEDATPWRFFAALFFELAAIRLFFRLARSPVRRTIDAVENGRPAEGADLLKFGRTFFFVIVASVAGVKFAGDDDLRQEVVTALFMFLGLALTVGPRAKAMRRDAPIARTNAQYLHFVCLTQGFMLPLSALFVVAVVSLQGLAGAHWPAIVAVYAVLAVFVVGANVYTRRTSVGFWGIAKPRASPGLVLRLAIGRLLVVAAVVVVAVVSVRHG